MRDIEGFSMVEMLIATALTLGLAAGAFSVLHPSQSAFEAHAEAADLQQRLRAAVTTMVVDIVAAGAGPDRGPFAGSLLRAFAPVLPYRRGTNADDPPGSFFDDRITLVSAPVAAPSTTIAADGPPLDSTWFAVAAQPQCAAATPLCLMLAGGAVAIFDGSGSVDFATVTAISSTPPVPMLEHADDRLAFTGYAPVSTSVVGMSVISYAFDRAAAQLIVSRGFNMPDAPVADNVVGLTFAYLGDPEPPRIATYGPLPPPVDVQGSSAAWPPGENCAFVVSDRAHVPRLPVLDGGPGLVALPQALLTDGPWCPDASSSNRWDADLLRVRAVVVTLRVQAAIAALRGPAGMLFANAGTGRNSSRWVPDREVRFQISPRNMNFGRAP
jgi:hypothetical protein